MKTTIIVNVLTNLPIIHAELDIIKKIKEASDNLLSTIITVCASIWALCIAILGIKLATSPDASAKKNAWEWLTRLLIGGLIVGSATLIANWIFNIAG